MSPAAADAITIPALVLGAALEFGDRPAVVDGETTLSYRELRDAALGFGAGLVETGIEPDDRVGVWAPNGARWIVAALGIWQAGAVLVPVNTRFKSPEAVEILGRSGAKALITVTDFLGTDYVSMLRSAQADLPSLSTTIVAEGPDIDATTSWEAFVDAQTPSSIAEMERRGAAVQTDDVSDILFTSGTTGTPKGVVQTHGRTLLVASDWVAMTGLEAGDRYLMVNPYFHMFGLKAGILAALAAGATMYPEPVFDVERVLSRVEEEEITILPGAPTIYQALLDHPDRAKHDLSSLRVAVTGAADIPVELIRRINDELPFSVVVTGYGLTEGGTAAATSPDDDAETVATTVGRPRPSFELRIVDDTGNEVTMGEPGEIVLRGGSIMLEYLDDPEATAEAVSADGWLRTGDLGIVGGDGCLRIVGRSKDMFIVGGFNAYPAEIENMLLHHRDVQQVAVIGIPEPRLGEVCMAFIVAEPDSSVSAEAIIAWSRDQMANYKVPRRVEFIDELPINATGKVVKEELRARIGSDGTEQSEGLS